MTDDDADIVALSSSAILARTQTALLTLDTFEAYVSQATSAFQSLVLQYEDNLTRVHTLEHLFAIVTDYVNNNSVMPHTPAAAMAKNFQLSDLTQYFVGNQSQALTMQSKPFGYDSERHYLSLVRLLRRSPMIVSAALSLCHGEVMSAHRKHIGSLCRMVVNDLFGDDDSGSDSSLIECIEAALIGMQHEVSRRTARAHPNGKGHASESGSTNGASATSDSVASAAVAASMASDTTKVTFSVPPLTINPASSSQHSYSPPISSPRHCYSVLDHSALPLKLLHEYNVRYGTGYLASILSEPLNGILASDTTMSLDADLMGGSSPTNTDTHIHTDSDDRLFSVCEQLLSSIVGSVDRLPHGIRYIAKVLFTLSDTHSHTHTHTHSHDDVDSDSDECLNDPSSPYRVVSDYLFLNWIINAIIHPEHYNLTLLFPNITSHQRRSLQAVSTVLIKLMSGSLFVFDSGRLIALNRFLTQWRKRIIAFIREIVDCEKTVSVSESDCVSRSRRPILALPNDLFCLHSLIKARFDARHSADSSAPVDPDTLSALQSLLTCLGDSLPYLPFQQNVYLVLHSGFPPVEFPTMKNLFRGQFDGDRRVELCADLLCSTLRKVSGRVSDSGKDFVTAMRQLSLSAVLINDLSTAALIDESLDRLERFLPSDYRSSDYRRFIVAIYRIVRTQLQSIQHSDFSHRLLLNKCLLENDNQQLNHREQSIYSSLRALQVRRLFELLKLKLKRFKKFLVTRKEKNSRGNGSKPVRATSLITSHSNDSLHYQPYYLNDFNDQLLLCSLVWPDSVSMDRLLCSACQKSLDKQRNILKSFYAKYIVGERIDLPLPTAKPVGTTSATSAGRTGASSTGNSVGSEPGEGHSLIQLNLGPPLDLTDVVVESELTNAIVTTLWSELDHRCPRADLTFYLGSETLIELCGRGFSLVFVLLSLNQQQLVDYDVPTIQSLVARTHTRADNDSDSDLLLLQSKVQSLTIPHVSMIGIDRVSSLWQSFVDCRSCQQALTILSQIRAILMTCLSHRTLIVSDSGGDGTVSVDDTASVDVGSIDDFMCLLIFTMLRSNPFGLLSQLSFVQSMLSQTANASKAFVDAMTAVKAIIELLSNCQAQLRPSDAIVARARNRGQTEVVITVDSSNAQSQLPMSHPTLPKRSMTSSASSTQLLSQVIASDSITDNDTD